MNKKRKNPKRLNINIDEEFHRQIKITSSYLGINMSEYVLQTIATRVRNDQINLNIPRGNQND